mmetsp:Transcript_18020/g.37157  ORF Transcript_18020/g.37157 Transcript_18020/m.37157 type:complete len:231 (+) Transcript_18020:2-694(+)
MNPLIANPSQRTTMMKATNLSIVNKIAVLLIATASILAITSQQVCGVSAKAPPFLPTFDIHYECKTTQCGQPAHNLGWPKASTSTTLGVKNDDNQERSTTKGIKNDVNESLSSLFTEFRRLAALPFHLAGITIEFGLGLILITMSLQILNKGKLPFFTKCRHLVTLPFQFAGISIGFLLGLIDTVISLQKLKKGKLSLSTKCRLRVSILTWLMQFYGSFTTSRNPFSLDH